MTLKTRFAASETLLNQREHLHDLVDMLWKNGPYRRSEIYSAMQTRLNEHEQVHISDMQLSQIHVIADMFDSYVQHRFAACAKCRHNAGKTDIGLVRCALTGEPFCAKYKNNSMILNRCEDYERSN